MELRSGSKLGGEQYSATTATSPLISKAESDKHSNSLEVDLEGTNEHANVHPASGSVKLPTSANRQGDCVSNGVTEGEKKSKKKKRKAKKSSKTKTEVEDKPPPGPTNQHRYSLRRSTGTLDLDSIVGWEALERHKTDRSEVQASRTPTKAAEAETPKSVQLPIMSRNRPRGPPTNRDNGIAANEEIDMWNKIIQDIRKAKEKNDKQKALAEQISALNEKIAREGNSKSSFHLFVLFDFSVSGLQFEQLK